MAKQEVKVLTYNVQQVPQRSVRAFAESLVNNDDGKNVIFEYDVLCFQEVFWDPHRRIIARGLKNGGYLHQVTKSGSEIPDWIPVLGWFSQDSGLFFAARYPIIKRRKRFERFEDRGVGFDASASKGVSYTEVKINDKKLFVFNTHLQSGNHPGIRENQMNQIKSAIDGRTCEMIDIHNLPINQDGTEYIGDFSIVLTGDLNVNEKDRIEEYEQLRDHIFKNGKDIYRTHTDDPGFTFGRGIKAGRYDFIFAFDYITIPQDLRTGNGIEKIKINEVEIIDAKVVKKKLDGRNVSDHFGVGATIKI